MRSASTEMSVKETIFPRHVYVDYKFFYHLAKFD